MNRPKRYNIVTVETLEQRRMLSATHAPLPVTNVVGVYDASAAYSNGQTQTFTVFISSQHGGAFAGTSEDFFSLAPSKITGTVNRRGVVHFRMKPVHFPGAVVVGQGTVDAADTEIRATVRVTVGRQTGTGTFTLVRELT
jgi:hypothetical protein